MVNKGVIIPKRDTVNTSLNEKHFIQALSMTYKEFQPLPKKHRRITKYYEYKRLDTLSLLLGIDLNIVIITEIVWKTHNSVVFMAFLK